MIDTMKTTITVIVDNISTEGIDGEWGLSLLAERGDKKILVDAGASDLYLTNMKKLGIDVADVDYAVLSHAHYDHANGMPTFFMNNNKARLYVRDCTSADCYAKKGFFRKYIGIPKKMMKNFPDRIEKVSGDYMITDGVWLIPHKTPGLDVIGKNELMFRKVNGRWTPDDYSHEQSLVIYTDKGLIIINSCSHGGVANIINEVRSTFPDKHVYGLIGGFHLFNKRDETIRELAGKIRETGIEYVCTGHCTKNRAYRILKEELGDHVDQMSVGFQIEF